MKKKGIFHLEAIKSTQLKDNIDLFNIRSFDLNLMVTLDSMMQKPSITKSANKLRINQLSMSHNL